MVDDLPGPIVLDDPDFLGLVVVLLFLVHKTERIRKWFAIWFTWLLSLFLSLLDADSSKVSDEKNNPDRVESTGVGKGTRFVNLISL